MLDALAAIAQFALYVGVLGACGGVLAAATLHAGGAAGRILESLVRAGAVLTIVATLLAAIVLVHQLGGEFDDTTISAILMSSVGAAGGMRLSGAVLLLMPSQHPVDTFDRGMRLTYAALISASFLFNGHGAAAGVGGGLMAGVHVAIAGWWIGSLVAMQRACAAQEAAEVAAIVQRFSRIAVGAIAGLVVAGSVLVVTLLAWPIAMTPYAATLATKIGLAMLALALAAYNKLRLTPRVLAGDAAGIGALRTVIIAELLVIGGVLLATTLLTTYNAPAE